MGCWKSGLDREGDCGLRIRWGSVIFLCCSCLSVSIKTSFRSAVVGPLVRDRSGIEQAKDEVTDAEALDASDGAGDYTDEY